MLDNKVKASIEKCVLCWLATSSEANIPNVSPKEIFTSHGIDTIIIANIASPQTVKNIRQNEQVCVSFIDILIQKGYQLKGLATIVTDSDTDYKELKTKLEVMTGGNFPFASITKIKVNQVKQILAPSYVFYPDTSEKGQIESAKKAYGLN